MHEIRVETSTGKPTFVVTHLDAAQVTVERLRHGIAHAAKPSMAAGADGQSDAEELARWAQLRDQGVISDAEFATKKAKLLG
jgi:Short C-terminal domain